MPSKVNSKKVQKKSVYTACWVQNDDGTLSLTVGSKNPTPANSPNAVWKGVDDNLVSQNVPDFNGNFVKSPAEAVAKKHSPPQNASPINVPVKILKPNRLDHGIDYQQHLQMKRRREMTSE